MTGLQLQSVAAASVLTLTGTKLPLSLAAGENTNGRYTRDCDRMN